MCVDACACMRVCTLAKSCQNPRDSPAMYRKRSFENRRYYKLTLDCVEWSKRWNSGVESRKVPLRCSGLEVKVLKIGK